MRDTTSTGGAGRAPDEGVGSLTRARPAHGRRGRRQPWNRNGESTSVTDSPISATENDHATAL